MEQILFLTKAHVFYLAPSKAVLANLSGERKRRALPRQLKTTCFSGSVILFPTGADTAQIQEAANPLMDAAALCVLRQGFDAC